MAVLSAVSSVPPDAKIDFAASVACVVARERCLASSIFLLDETVDTLPEEMDAPPDAERLDALPKLDMSEAMIANSNTFLSQVHPVAMSRFLDL